jgi:hypothetical protein
VRAGWRVCVRARVRVCVCVRVSVLVRVRVRVVLCVGGPPDDSLLLVVFLWRCLARVSENAVSNNLEPGSRQAPGFRVKETRIWSSVEVVGLCRASGKGRRNPSVPKKSPPKIRTERSSVNPSRTTTRLRILLLGATVLLWG